MTIQWDEELPRDSDGYSTLPADLRAFKADLATAFSQSLNWPGSGSGSTASAGQALLGGFRASLASWSNMSAPSPLTTGRLFHVTATVHGVVPRYLFTHSSAATLFAGSASGCEGPTAVITPVHWVLSSGTAAVAGGSTNASFGVVYGGPVYVTASVYTSIATMLLGTISTVTSGGFTYLVGPGTFLDDTVEFQWTSLGTLSF